MVLEVRLNLTRGHVQGFPKKCVYDKLFYCLQVLSLQK